MLPYISAKLMPWVTFGNNTVHLKPNAPEEVMPLYEKLKSTIDKFEEETIKGLPRNLEKKNG